MSIGDEQKRDALNRAVDRFVAAAQSGAPRLEAGEETSDNMKAVAEVWRSLEGLAEHHAVLDMRMAARQRMLARRQRRAWTYAVAASIALISLGVTTAWMTLGRSPTADPARPVQVLANANGMPRTFRLNDGSQIIVDAQSSVRLIRWSQASRLAMVDRGRAYFDVVHDEKRPLTVFADGVRTVDLGTVFQVETIPDGARVSLIRGAVRVSIPSASGKLRMVDLKPDSILTVRSGQWELRRGGTASLLQWRNGAFTFDNKPLSEIVSTLNPYLAHPIEITDSRATKIRLSGVFRADDPEGLRDALVALGQGDAVKISDGRVPLPDN